MNDVPWLAVARNYIGTKEVPGSKDVAPTIAKWLLSLHAWWRDDETPWCGVAVAAWMREAGIQQLPVHWYRAKGWLGWGITLTQPCVGCIVVFERPGGGHVGLVDGRDQFGRLLVIGGNQGDRVSRAAFETSRVLGYRWPSGQPRPTDPLPIYAGGLPPSTDEA